MNDFTDIRRFEQEKENAARTEAILEFVKRFDSEMTELKKLMNLVREDLRNLDNLRALRKKE